ncbi:MAG: HXXEE domain-containing protein [Clostridium sp.]
MHIIIWLFPILFIFHDFEEIIFMQSWLNKNKLYLSNKFPKLSKKLLAHFDDITTETFAASVAEEFILISIVTIISYTTNWFNLWIGLFLAFTIHLIIHCIQILIIRRYIPAIVTSVICLPICTYIIKKVLVLFPLNTIILYSFLGLIIMVINLIFVHNSMKVFKKWLEKYEG